MISALLLPVAALASLLAGEGVPQPFEGVSLPPKAQVSAQGRKTAVEALGHGLRYKKIAFLKVSVYVGELFSADPKSFLREKSKALESLERSPALAMQMTFLRDVDAAKIQEAFRESFEENKISVEDASIQQFLNAVKAGGPARQGKTMTIASEKVGSKEIVTFEGSDGRAVSIEGPLELRHKIFSLWLGKPTDGGVESLQEQILAP